MPAKSLKNLRATMGRRPDVGPCEPRIAKARRDGFAHLEGDPQDAALRALADLYREWESVPGWVQVDIIALCAGIVAECREAH